MPSLLKLVPTQAASLLEARETPSLFSSDPSVTGIVAAVLDELNAVAHTFADAFKKRSGETRANTLVNTRYQEI